MQHVAQYTLNSQVPQSADVDSLSSAMAITTMITAATHGHGDDDLPRSEQPITLIPIVRNFRGPPPRDPLQAAEARTGQKISAPKSQIKHSTFTWFGLLCLRPWGKERVFSLAKEKVTYYNAIGSLL